MISRNPPPRRQSGFILATVLVFLVVLSLTAFLGAKLTRGDIQVVNNLQNEKEALAIAEAGVHEALYRVSLPAGEQATISGINGGSAFTAAITPTPTAGWNAQVLLTTSGPSTSGSTLTTPSLQPVSTSRLPYTTTSAGTDTLTIGWDLCTNSTDTGCSGYPTETRRQLPLSSPRPVVKITSTGTSGNARRTLVVKAVDCSDTTIVGPGSIVSLGTGCTGSTGQMAINGGNTITASGPITINAGAGTSTPNTCYSATTGGSQSLISATDINMVGTYSSGDHFSPTPNTGVLAVSDPYADPLMRPPCFTGGPTPCQGTTITTVRNGTASAPSVRNVSTNNTTLDPGIYYGGIKISATNVRLNPGVYIIAGGGFKSGNGNTSVYSNTSGGDGSGGVMIFNTQDPSNTSGFGAIAAFDLSNGNNTASLAAPTSGTWMGVVLYQDRRSTLTQPTVTITGGNSSRVLDGLVYAPLAAFTVQGGSPSGTLIGGALIASSVSMTGNSSLIVQAGGTNPPTANCSGIAYVPIGWQDF